ncbi:hypothetical protein [Hoeflea sp. 108]|uniref:hypothetical protein n=1 Tax=Hoeflea sp. 108 TaxID=1116369 RepID=UPI0012F99C1F|nr:hypothetical protein [Hoeflea sp. 108]
MANFIQFARQMAALFRSVKGKGAKTGAPGSIATGCCVHDFDAIFGGLVVFPLSQVEPSLLRHAAAEQTIARGPF